MMRKALLIVIAFAICGAVALATTNAENEGKSAGKEVTFSKDVAPIFFKSCAECHRAGEIAPFSVMSYKEIRPWAKSIKEQVISKEMPPWHADPNHGEWMNDRRLSQTDIDKIVAWVDGGAKEGSPKDLPPAPKFEGGWNIGLPDETFSIPEQNVPAEGVVAYQYFKVPTNFKEDRWITAAEIRSTGRASVHHVIVFIQDPKNPTRTDGNLLAGFAPGEQPARFPDGFAKRVPAGANLMFQMHYTPNGTATKDVTTIGLKYSKEEPKHQVLTRPVLNTGFKIPAGAPNHEVKSFYTFKEDAHITSYMPHMHLRGKDFEIKAIFPDGTSKILLSVPKYDFNWQTYYVPKSPVAIPQGTKIECTAHFDNSSGNKFNPDPSKEVRWGDQTWEEMMIGWLSYYLDKSDTAKPAASASSSTEK
ncbi:MAG: cytochrome c [Blastocatellales bacterium]